MIILEKTKKKKFLSKNIADIIALKKVTRISIFIKFAEKYIGAMSNAILDATKELKLTSVKKY